VASFTAALASKQHVLLLLPFAARWRDFGWRRTVVALGLAAAFTLPWFASAPRDFIDGALLYHLHLEPRPDSLSLYTTVLRSGHLLHFGVVMGVTAAAIGLAMWRLPRDSTGFVLGSAMALGVFDLVNK